jgi:hypothetical protein
MQLKITEKLKIAINIYAIIDNRKILKIKKLPSTSIQLFITEKLKISINLYTIINNRKIK